MQNERGAEKKGERERGEESEKGKKSGRRVVDLAVD